MEVEHLRLVEISVSYRFAQEHHWIVQGITGFLSAYYMEKPEFRVRRHYDELETGMHVWLCETPTTMDMSRLLKRLAFDIPPSQVSLRIHPESGIARHVIDLKIDDSGEGLKHEWKS